MKVPDNLGQKIEDPCEYISITFRKLSEKLGKNTPAIFAWLQAMDPKMYLHLVTDPEVEINWRKNHDIGQLKKDLHEFYQEWIQVKKSWDEKWTK
jgi:hypothetical protein